MTPITFTKMHGLGNDFIVLDCRFDSFDWEEAQIQKFADRHCGIGFDQLLIIEPAQSAQVDFTYRIFNADGSEVEHCGNGARCFGKYLRDKQLFDFHRPVKVAVKRGNIDIDYQGQTHGLDQFRVAMGVPDFTPFTAQQESALAQPILVDAETRYFSIVSMGNPHAVCEVDDIQTAAVVNVGKALQNHPLFPEKVNVGFMQIHSPEKISLRVFERGAGETKACGTGACAAVAAGIAQGKLAEKVHVELSGGNLCIEWQGSQHSLFMTGPAESVFEGKILL